MAGELKNLVFASSGPKPKLVLRDALANTIEITENAHTCLVYDRPLPEEGLTWTRWSTGGPPRLSTRPTCTLPASTSTSRLQESLDPGPERTVLRTYAQRLRSAWRRHDRGAAAAGSWRSAKFPEGTRSTSPGAGGRLVVRGRLGKPF